MFKLKIFVSKYQSPLGDMRIISEENDLVSLQFKNQKYYKENIYSKNKIIEKDNKTIEKTKKYLDKYFKGEKIEKHNIKLAPKGTEFQKQTWTLLNKIPYGQTTTYKEIGEQIAKIRNKNKMSAQAIGTAIGHNPIAIIIPCHRVIGTNGKLTGYAAGIDKKEKLLQLEQGQKI